MSRTIKNTFKKKYVDSRSENAIKQFQQLFNLYVSERSDMYNEIIFLCIGTDRATGDCLGPLVGYKLQSCLEEKKNIFLYGTLDYPVHAKNLSENIEFIKTNHDKSSIIIAIDASLGNCNQVGLLTIKKGSLMPGAGMNKNLPSVGDISITGIVNYYGIMEPTVLQSTRLSLVMRMADIISKGIERWLNIS